MPLDFKSQDKYKKITDYTTTTKQVGLRSNTDSPQTQSTLSQKRPISPNQSNNLSVSKRIKSALNAEMNDNISTTNSPSVSNNSELPVADWNRKRCTSKGIRSPTN